MDDPYNNRSASDAALDFCRRNGSQCIDNKAVAGLNEAEISQLERLGFTVSISSGNFATSLPGQFKISLNIDHGPHTDPKLRAEAGQIALATEHVMKPETYKTTVTRDGSVSLYFQLGGQ